MNCWTERARVATRARSLSNPHSVHPEPDQLHVRTGHAANRYVATVSREAPRSRSRSRWVVVPHSPHCRPAHDTPSHHRRPPHDARCTHQSCGTALVRAPGHRAMPTRRTNIDPTWNRLSSRMSSTTPDTPSDSPPSPLGLRPPRHLTAPAWSIGHRADTRDRRA